MEQLKVTRKNSIVLNTILFLILSFLFIYLQYAYRHQLSPFSTVYMRKSIELFWYIAAAIIIASFYIWRLHRYAVLAYSSCILLVSFKVVEGLFLEFNKIIVIALFFYSVISYFLYQLLNQYLLQASINPNYDSADLFPPLLKVITCRIEWGEKQMSGYLTNWDSDGCFIQLEQAQKLPRRVKLTIGFEGREFVQEGEVVAHALDLTGIGLRFQQTSKYLKVFNWSEFTEFLHELGFKPERLR